MFLCVSVCSNSVFGWSVSAAQGRMVDRIDASTPLVSVGMPLFNSAPWVEEAVESILRQSLCDFELIIVDNASTDNSWEICQRLARQDRRIRLFRNEHNIGANRNYALA